MRRLLPAPTLADRGLVLLVVVLSASLTVAATLTSLWLRTSADSMSRDAFTSAPHPATQLQVTYASTRARAVPEGATSAQAAEVLWREKRREDRLRRRARVTRWLWNDAMRGARLLVRLGEVGIRPTPRSTWFDLGAPAATA